MLNHSLPITTSSVFIDTNLTFAPHVRRVVDGFWQIRQLWKIRQSLSVENAKTPVHALVASRVHFCNSVLYHAAAVSIRPYDPSTAVCLKGCSAARLVSKLRKFDRVSISTITRNELHWLPVDQSIVYKLCLLVYNVNTSRPHHICCHCEHHCQLPQLVVICGQQPKAILTFRVQVLSHMVHVPSQFQVPYVGMHYRHP